MSRLELGVAQREELAARARGTLTRRGSVNVAWEPGDATHYEILFVSHSGAPVEVAAYHDLGVPTGTGTLAVILSPSAGDGVVVRPFSEGVNPADLETLGYRSGLHGRVVVAEMITLVCAPESRMLARIREAHAETLADDPPETQEVPTP